MKLASDATGWPAGELHPESPSGRGLSRRLWAIQTQEDHTIGYIGLGSFTWCSAELRVYILDPSFIGQGYGTDAVSAFIDFVFTRTALRYLYLRVFKDNLAAVRCYKKCGFQVEAVLKAGGHGPCRDVLLMRRERL
jgi:RimJ/RimL family protein N-acetyltransferase